MREIFYVSCGQVREQARLSAEKGTLLSFKETLQILYEQHTYKREPPALPSECRWEKLDNPAFFDLLWELPVINPFSDWRPPGDVIAAEELIPKRQGLFALIYIPDIVPRLHMHDYYEIDIVMKGNAVLYGDGQQRTLHAGDFCIVSPGFRHDMTVGKEDIAVSLVLRQSVFVSSFLDRLSPEAAQLFSADQKDDAGYYLFSAGADTGLFRLVKGIFMEIYLPDGYADGCAVSLLVLLLSELMRQYGDQASYFDRRGSDAGIVRILRYVEENYQTLTLSELANHFHYSTAYMSKLIKKHTGKNLVQLLTDMRMKRAEELLLHTSLRLDEVAELSGYESADHFSRQFRKIYGLPPGQFRKLPDNLRRNGF